MDDVRAVMDAVGSESAALFGYSEGGTMCTLFAATHPTRTSALIMNGAFARRTWAPDYPWGPTEEQRQGFVDQVEREWGGPVGIDERAPSMAQDERFRQWWARFLRASASPAAAATLLRMNTEIDIRQLLPAIRVPTLILHSVNDRLIDIGAARYMAARIPGAKLVELQGIDHMPWGGDSDAHRRRDRGVPHRCSACRRARPRTRHGPVHRYRRRHREGRQASATAAGTTCSTIITRSYVANSCAFADGRSTLPATGFLPPSTVLPAPSAALAPSPTAYHVRHRSARRPAHGRVRGHRRQARRNLRPHRGPRRGLGEARRSARVKHRKGPGRGLRAVLPRPRSPAPQGRAR